MKLIGVGNDCCWAGSAWGGFMGIVNRWIWGGVDGAALIGSGRNWVGITGVCTKLWDGVMKLSGNCCWVGKEDSWKAFIGTDSCCGWNCVGAIDCSCWVWAEDGGAMKLNGIVCCWFWNGIVWAVTFFLINVLTNLCLFQGCITTSTTANDSIDYCCTTASGCSSTANSN